MTEPTVIFVSLREEGVDVWRPALAELYRENIYRLVEQPYNRDVERWQFEPGDYVVCELVDADEGSILAAVSPRRKP